MKINPALYIFLLFIICFWSSQLQAQIKLVPVQRSQSKPVTHATYRLNSTQMVDDTVLSLPFWDDFAANNSGHPDTSLWMNSENVLINNGAGINAPSINIATFDGIDAFGRPYSQSQQEIGLGDELTSQPFDLSGISEDQNDSVYLSFFYQKEGNGELPDEEDSIRLQFKNADSVWITQWSVTGTSIVETDTFILQLEKVDQSFFHSNFQFRFQWYGRLSGPFDTWNIDYILLNDGRSSSDITFDDRTITSKPTSIFKEFYAIPVNQFFADTARFIGNASVGIKTLSTRQDQAAELTSLLRSGNLVDTLDAPPGKPSDVVFSPLERQVFTASSIDPSLLNPEADSLNMELLIYYNASGDQPGKDSIDFRANDTISAHFILDDYFAYDDGTAEFGAGVNQARGRLAVEFILSEPDVITEIDINFASIGSDLQGQVLEFFIAKFLDNNKDTAIYRQNYVVQRSNSINEFQTIKLNRSIPVSDTIFIGFRQSANDFVPVGLDKNTDSSDKIFFNALGAWQQDTTLKGSLMFRPVFGEDIILGKRGQEVVSRFISLFPNPSEGIVNIKGRFDDVDIYDISGRKLKMKQDIHSGIKSIDLSEYPKGVYIFQFKRNSKVQREKVIIY